MALDRWGQVEQVAARFGADENDVRDVLRSLQPRASIDRFEWLQALCQRHELGARALRTAIAAFGFAGEHGYLWPGQRSLAAKAGYDDDAEIRRGLVALVAVGALRKLRVTDLPEELAIKATGCIKAGGSGRSFKGKAYALVPPSQWEKSRVTGTPCPSDHRDTVSLYNLQGKPLLASPDSCVDAYGDKPETSPLVETSHLGTDGGTHV